MKAITNCTVLLLTAALFGLPAGAAEKHSARTDGKNPGFEKIKSLVGDWEVEQSSGEHAMPNGVNSYKLTAGGSAVAETVFQGTEHEMLTLYYVDTDGSLCLTHYCVLGNRPLMRALPQSSPNTIVFKCRPEDNAAIASDDHMHQATFTFVDPNHVKAEWVLYSGGKPASAHAFTLVRKKK
jgi:hypothetical protein